MLKDKEINERNGGNDEPIVSKGGQCRLIHEFKEPQDRYVSYDKGRNKADDNHDQIVAAKIAQALQEVVETGHNHDRYGNNEGKVCRCFTAKAKNSRRLWSTRTGRSRATGPRSERSPLKRLAQRSSFQHRHRPFSYRAFLPSA